MEIKLKKTQTDFGMDFKAMSFYYTGRKRMARVDISLFIHKMH